MLTRLLFTLLACAASPAALTLAAEPVWRAQRQTVYEPSESGKSLVFSFDNYIIYNAEGSPVETTTIDADGVKQRTQTTYANGRQIRVFTEQLVGDEWKAVRLLERTYDERTGVITSNVETNYYEGKAYPGNCYRRTIRRTPAGDVAEVTVSVLFQGRYDPTQKITIKPNSIEFSELMYAAGSWATTVKYTDIVWDRTDGQIVTIDDLYTGNNRIATAHFENPNGNLPYYDYDINVTYGEGADFDCVMTGLYQGLEDAIVCIGYRESVDPDGTESYAMTTTYDIVNSVEPAECYREEMRVDKWGLETLYQTSAWLEGEEPEIEVERVTDITYDATIGYPLQAIATEDGTPLTRVDFADYIDCSQAGSIRELNAGQKPVKYFNLLGQPVGESSRGFKISKYGVKAHY